MVVLPARESLELNAKIYGIPEDRFERTVAEMTEMLNVRDKLNISVRELSLGERMKMELIASLLHQPKILFLDEPTIGLDVVSQKTVREFLKHHNAKQKTTILLTSHYMADIQALCERVIIIDHGKISFDGKLSEVVDRFADFKLISIELDQTAILAARGTSGERTEERGDLDKSASPPQPSPPFHGGEGDFSRYGELVEKTAGSIKLKVKRDRVIPVCKALLDELPVRDIDIEEVPIEDVIRQIFAR